MTTITEIFTREVGRGERHGEETYSPSPRASCPFCKVIEAILHCRTGEYGSTVYQCQSCGQTHTIHCSWGNRHGPQCQHHKTRQWLQKQLDRQLPGPHFLITFTVPEELRDFIRSHQKVCYEALFEASSEALKLLARDARFIGTNLPGFTGILHTRIKFSVLGVKVLA